MVALLSFYTEYRKTAVGKVSGFRPYPGEVPSTGQTGNFILLTHSSSEPSNSLFCDHPWWTFLPWRSSAPYPELSVHPSCPSTASAHVVPDTGFVSWFRACSFLGRENNCVLFALFVPLAILWLLMMISLFSLLFPVWRALVYLVFMWTLRVICGAFVSVFPFQLCHRADSRADFALVYTITLY